MATNDQEVFAQLGADDSTGIAIEFFAYAIYSNEKFEWIDQHEKTTGSYPTEAEISTWISQITRNRFEGYIETAARVFAVAARDYMTTDIEQAKR